MNPRKSNYNIHDFFLNRWSPRSFKQDPIPEDALYSLFEAARWAPSGNNLQPWRYIIARKPEDRSVFLSFINEGNVRWCKNAPVLALLVSKSTKNDGKPAASHAFDAGASWGYLALEAVHQGLSVHAMGGFDKQAARQVLNIPDEYVPQIAIAIGYRDDKDKLPADMQDRETPNDRMPLNEILIEGSF